MTPTRCGTGEQGKDLVAHFNQTTIFSIITSPSFQKKHPCYLFAPMVPKGALISRTTFVDPIIACLVRMWHGGGGGNENLGPSTKQSFEIISIA